MSIRSKTIILLITTLALSGCSTSDPVTKTIPESSEQASSRPESSISQEEYDEIIERIQQNDKNNQQLEENLNNAESGNFNGSSSSNSNDEKLENNTDNIEDISDPQWDKYYVASLAFQNLPKLNGSADTSTKNLIISDNVTLEQAEYLQSGLYQAFDMWDDRYGIIPGYTVVAFTYEDGAWADSQNKIYNVGIPRNSWISWINYWDQGESCMLGASSPKAYFICIPKDINKLKKIALESNIHEYFHSIQSLIGINHKNTPVWIGEGSATYFGFAISSSSKQKNIDYHGNMSTYYLGPLRDIADSLTENDIIEIYTALEVKMDAESIPYMEKYNGYTYGSLASEYLIGTYGYNTFMSFLEDIGDGVDWKAAFENSFSMSTNEFYVVMLKYLQEIY